MSRETVLFRISLIWLVVVVIGCACMVAMWGPPRRAK
jgi:hypothetical protein